MKKIKKKAFAFINKYKFPLFTVFALLWFFWFGSPTYSFYNKNKEEAERIKEQIKFYEEETKRFENFRLKLQEDKEAIEKYARENYHMKRKNEVVYIIEEIETSTKE